MRLDNMREQLALVGKGAVAMAAVHSHEVAAQFERIEHGLGDIEHLRRRQNKSVFAAERREHIVDAVVNLVFEIAGPIVALAIMVDSALDQRALRARQEASDVLAQGRSDAP